MSLKSSFNSNSTKLLIFSNLITIVFALYFNWNLFTLMFVYWAQSVIIELFTVLKIIYLKHEDKNKRVFYGLFFAFHYGLFHFVYFGFILSFYLFSLFSSGIPASSDIAAGIWEFIFTTIILILFFINHLYSFWAHRKIFEEKKHSAKSVMLSPYPRIVPMHLTIIFGFSFLMFSQSPTSGEYSFGFFVLLLFLVLKSVADIFMHVYEHKDDD